MRMEIHPGPGLKKSMAKVQKANPGFEYTENELALMGILRRAYIAFQVLFLINSLRNGYNALVRMARNDVQGDWKLSDTLDYYAPGLRYLNEYREEMKELSFEELLKERELLDQILKTNPSNIRIRNQKMVIIDLLWDAEMKMTDEELDHHEAQLDELHGA